MYATYCISVHVMALLVCLYFNYPLELSLVYHKLAVSTGKIHDEKQGHLSSLSALCLRRVRLTNAEIERTFGRILQ